MIWASLAFTAGPAFADALSTRSEMVQRVDSAGLWLTWLAGLVVTFVASSASLTAIRVLGPATLAAAVASALAGATGPTATIAVVAGLITTCVCLNREVADCYVNGSSYGDERRYLLRTPAPLLLGPAEAAVALVVAGIVGGPMLVSSGSWVLGAAAIVVGWPMALLSLRALHGLSRRWFVFVPAGVVVHDFTTLIDSLMVRRNEIATIGWASEPTAATDLTANSLGRVIQVSLTAPASLLPRPSRRPGSPAAVVEPIETNAVLITPARAHALLADAAGRHIAVIT